MTYLSIFFSRSGRINKPKKKKRIEDLNNVFIRYELFDVLRTLHSVNTFFSSMHGTFNIS